MTDKRAVTSGLRLSDIQEKQQEFLDNMESRETLGDNRGYLLECSTCGSEDRFYSAHQCGMELRHYHAGHKTWLRLINHSCDSSTSVK